MKDFNATPLSFINEPRMSMTLDPKYEAPRRNKDWIFKLLGGDRYITVEEAARIAFRDEDDAELTPQDKERLKNEILKHGVDYYMGTLNTEYPGDVIRNLEFLFTRDDKKN